MATGLYAGTTLADDGSPILLFDPAGLAEVGGVRLEAQERAARIAEGPAAAVAEGHAGAAVPRPRRRPPRAASRDRRPHRGGAGERRQQAPASSASSSATRSCRSPARRADELGDDKVRLFRLNDGAHEIGYAFREVIDFAAIDNDIIPAEQPGEISGVTLIGGEPAELVDAHWLFANHVGAAARPTRAAGLPPAGRRSVDAEHASPDRRGRRLSRHRRRATRAMPTW